MIDSRKIGAYISNLRKERDWTQMELAEYLNVTHQAVSKWERGESLPDIATFPRLAELFGVTVDDLLNGGEKVEQSNGFEEVVREIANDRPEQVAEMVNSGQFKMDVLAEMAPMLKASMLHRIAERLDRSHLIPETILRLAPFLPRETLDMLVRQAEDGNLNWDIVIGLAPFISRETLSRLVRSVIDGEFDPKRLVPLAPFMDGEHLEDIVEHLPPESLTPDLLANLAPFLGKDFLSRYVVKLINVHST